MDIKERAQLVRELRLDLKQNENDGYDEQPIVDGFNARRRARKIKLTRSNRAARMYGLSPAEVRAYGEDIWKYSPTFFRR